jgi:hypothetical protein
MNVQPRISVVVLAASILVLAAFAGCQNGPPCVVAASTYDRTCKKDSDCVGVPPGGDTCGPTGPPSGDVYCRLAAVSASVAGQYRADLQAALASHGTERDDSCPPLAAPVCDSGVCSVPSWQSGFDAGAD